MGRKDLAVYVLDRLSADRPEPTTELDHADPYELLVAVILSAQCTDERVNQVTPGLFAAYPTIADLARAEPADVLPHIASITFPNNKARHLAGMARMVMNEFGGRVPETPNLLQKLPGVGRKTALVVAGTAFGFDGIPVDTHVFRVAHRLGLVTRAAHTPEAVERQLRRVIPGERLTDAHHQLILHGRYVCKARSPECQRCPLTGRCAHFAALDKLPDARTDLDKRRGPYFCGTRSRYFEQPVLRADRSGVEQLSCPHCGSMNVFETRSGRTTRRVHDPRIS